MEMSSGKVISESEVVYYSSYKTTLQNFLQVIKSKLRRLGITSKTKHQSKDPPPNQTQVGTTQSTEATFVVTSRSVASQRTYRKPPRKPVTSGRGPQTNSREI